MMLSIETPMNSPNKPPQLAMKSAIVEVSDRFSDRKWCSLKNINSLLLISALHLKKNYHKKMYKKFKNIGKNNKKKQPTLICCDLFWMVHYYPRNSIEPVEFPVKEEIEWIWVKDMYSGGDWSGVEWTVELEQNSRISDQVVSDPCTVRQAVTLFGHN